MAGRTGINKIKVNPIVAALQNEEGAIRGLSGYLAEGTNGRVLLYRDLSLDAALELDPGDILHVVDGAEATDPSTVFVRGQARVALRQSMTVDSLAAAPTPDCVCVEADETDVAYLAVGGDGGGGAGGTALTCKQRLDRCKAKCANKGAFKQGCLDSCAASYRLCKGPIGGAGGGGWIIY